jgi:hypothetical protein
MVKLNTIIVEYKSSAHDFVQMQSLPSKDLLYRTESRQELIEEKYKFKREKDLNRQFSKEDPPVTSEHMKR